MNWKVCQITDHELDQLIRYNQSIKPGPGHPHLAPNAGVELQTESGRRHDAIYDGTLKAIRNLNTHNPQFKSMKNRDLALYNDHLLNEDITTIVVDGFFGKLSAEVKSNKIGETLTA